MKRLFILLLLPVLAFTACKKEDPVVPGGNTTTGGTTGGSTTGGSTTGGTNNKPTYENSKLFLGATLPTGDIAAGASASGDEFEPGHGQEGQNHSVVGASVFTYVTFDGTPEEKMGISFEKKTEAPDYIDVHDIDMWRSIIKEGPVKFLSTKDRAGVYIDYQKGGEYYRSYDYDAPDTPDDEEEFIITKVTEKPGTFGEQVCFYVEGTFKTTLYHMDDPSVTMKVTNGKFKMEFYTAY